MGKFDLTDRIFLKQLRKQVTYLCTVKYKIGNIDDMFQSICVKMLERPDTTSNIEFLFIDVLRDEYGKKSNVNYEMRRSMLSGASYLDTMKRETSTSHEDKIINKIDVEKMVKSVECPVARQSIYDVYFFDWRKQEVAEKLNVSPATVSVREKWAFEDIREEFPYENLRMLH